MKRKPRYLVDSPQDRQRHYYRAHKSMGKCARCSNPPADGRVCCQECLDKMAAGKRQAREQGICVDCWTAPALPGKRYCAAHHAERQQRATRRYTIRLIRKICTRCGTQRARPGYVLCAECSTAQARYYQQGHSAEESKQRNAPCS